MDREQATGGLCTWILQRSDGKYICDPSSVDGACLDFNHAHAWFSEGRALEVAKRTSWIGASARCMRGRP